MEPNWEKVSISKLQNQTVYEIELSNPQNVFVGKVDPKLTLEQTFSRSSIKLILFKNINDSQITDGCYMTTSADTKISYMQTQNFTGTISYYNLSGNFVNGWEYKNGKAILSSQNVIDKNGKPISTISGNKLKAMGTNKMKIIKSISLLSSIYTDSIGIGLDTLIVLPPFDPSLVPLEEETCVVGQEMVYRKTCITAGDATYGWHDQIVENPGSSTNCTTTMIGWSPVTTCRTNQSGGATGGYSGGGGGSGGSATYKLDCAGVPNGKAYNSDCGCIGGTTGLTECPPGEKEFKEKIKDNPFALYADTVDCEQLKKWLSIAKFTPDAEIISKLASITNPPAKQIAWIQKIDDAFSSVVNMDYFSVKVSELPTYNGQQLTAGQLLKYIRINLNNLTNGGKQFYPYNTNGINDTDLWNSTNPKGSIIAIDLPGPENGSVITSYSSTNKWTFTTIHEPMYSDHLVSGNRDFGYIQNPDNTYTFYTKGVDRLTSWSGTAFQEIPDFFQKGTGIPFSSADALWESLQTGIKNFVNNHAGNASNGTKQTFRPDWVMVKQVLDGKQPLSKLSKNCPD